MDVSDDGHVNSMSTTHVESGGSRIISEHPSRWAVHPFDGMHRGDRGRTDAGGDRIENEKMSSPHVTNHPHSQFGMAAQRPKYEGSKSGTNASVGQKSNDIPVSPSTIRSNQRIETDPIKNEHTDMSRSERKRNREKKRRSDVNKGFDDLFVLLTKIDPSLTSTRYEVIRGNRQGDIKFGDNHDDCHPLSRVELINRAVVEFRRIHCENEERKKQLAELNRAFQLTLAGRNVTMTVPMLVPIEEDPLPNTLNEDGGGMSPHNSFFGQGLSLQQRRDRRSHGVSSDFPPSTRVPQVSIPPGAAILAGPPGLSLPLAPIPQGDPATSVQARSAAQTNQSTSRRSSTDRRGEPAAWDDSLNPQRLG